ACLNVCPVYSRTGGHAYGSVYPGPIGAILTPQLRGIENASSLPFASTLCGACYEVCPVKIDIPRVLLHLREKAVDAKGGFAEGIAMGLAGWAFKGERRYATAQRLATPPTRFRSLTGSLHKLPFPLSGWARTRDLKWPVQGSFRDWWRRGGPSPGRSGSTECGGRSTARPLPVGAAPTAARARSTPR